MDFLAGLGGGVWTLVAFILALSIIVAVHEYGQVLGGLRMTPTTARCGIYSYMIRDAQRGLLERGLHRHQRSALEQGLARMVELVARPADLELKGI